MAIIFSIVSSIFELLSFAGGAGGAFALIGFVAGSIQFGLSVVYQLFVMGIQLSTQAIVYRRLKTGA